MQRDARDEGESARDGQGHGPVDGPRSRSRSEKLEAAVARMRTAGWRAEGTSLYVQQRRRDRVGARREKQNGAGCCFVSLFVCRSLFVTVSEERSPVGADGAGTWQPRARHRADTCTRVSPRAGALHRGVIRSAAGRGTITRDPRSPAPARARGRARPPPGAPPGRRTCRGRAARRECADNAPCESCGRVPSEEKRGGARERLARLIASAVLSCNRREAEKLMLFASTYPGGARRRLTFTRYRETKQTQPHGHAPARRPSHGFRVVAIPPPVVGPPPTRPNPAAFAASYLSL